MWQVAEAPVEMDHDVGRRELPNVFEERRIRRSSAEAAGDRENAQLPRRHQS
jgi:hypothetical protein